MKLRPKKPEYEYQTYGMAKIWLEAGWYTPKDVEQLKQAFDHMDDALKRSMEPVKNVRQPKT